MTKLSDNELVISILNVKQEELSPELNDNWDDLLSMLEDIREHAKNNGRAVINEDRPMELRLGWRCTNTNKTWTIRISNLKKCIAVAEPVTADILKRAIQTQEGKLNLTKSLNSKI